MHIATLRRVATLDFGRFVCSAPQSWESKGTPAMPLTPQKIGSKSGPIKGMMVVNNSLIRSSYALSLEGGWVLGSSLRLP